MWLVWRENDGGGAWGESKEWGVWGTGGLCDSVRMVWRVGRVGKVDSNHLSRGMCGMVV